MISLGLMQGRLTPSLGRGIQFFPFDSWDLEFEKAAKLGLAEIEFIFDLERFEENPLWSDSGITAIQSQIKSSGVKVNHVLADFFLPSPLWTTPNALEIVERLLIATKKIGARTLEIPFVDKSSIISKDVEDSVVVILTKVVPIADELGITIGLETDYPPQKVKALLSRFDGKVVRANYDLGNSAALGFDVQQEMATYGPYISNIHIKDRVLGGKTCPLGTGNAKFDRFFGLLKQMNYSGSLILQVARGEDHHEEETIRKQIGFLSNYIKTIGNGQWNLA